MNITSSTQDNTTTLALDGWLDTSTAPQLADDGQHRRGNGVIIGPRRDHDGARQEKFPPAT